MASEILLATRSVDKLQEIRATIGSATRVQLLTLDDLGIAVASAEDEIERHRTFLENAVAKARYFAQLTGRLTLADDSGLMVDALNGAPGVRTRRFAVDSGYVASDVVGKELDEANNALLLEQLRAVPDEKRQARYVCAAALAPPDGKVITAIGTCSGRIARAPGGSGGFGYDPLFIVPEFSLTFAQLPGAEKLRRSHRARALRALAPHLK